MKGVSDNNAQNNKQIKGNKENLKKPLQVMHISKKDTFQKNDELENENDNAPETIKSELTAKNPQLIKDKRKVEINKKNILNCLINSTGNVLLGGEGVEIKNLSKTIRQKLAENDKLVISVKAHKASSYKDYVRVIDQLKQANATRISIAESN